LTGDAAMWGGRAVGCSGTDAAARPAGAPCCGRSVRGEWTCAGLALARADLAIGLLCETDDLVPDPRAKLAAMADAPIRASGIAGPNTVAVTGMR
jgi:hypothetical protein